MYSKPSLAVPSAFSQGSFLLRWTRKGEELARTGSRMFRATKFFLSPADGGRTGEATLPYWPRGVFPLTSYIHRMSAACNDNPTNQACCCEMIEPSTLSNRPILETVAKRQGRIYREAEEDVEPCCLQTVLENYPENKSSPCSKAVKNKGSSAAEF